MVKRNVGNVNGHGMRKGKEVENDVMVVKQPLSLVPQNNYAETTNAKVGSPGIHRRTCSREMTKTNCCRVNELHTPPSVEPMIEHKLDPVSPGGYDALVTPVTLSGSQTLKLPQTLIRSRSSRQSRDLHINVDALLTPNPTTYYNCLLQDIQNFHHKNTSNSNSNSSSNTPSTLPPCSIFEAVADVNSSSKSNPNYSFYSD